MDWGPQKVPIQYWLAKGAQSLECFSGRENIVIWDFLAAL
jgi:hypothetical protein